MGISVPVQSGIGQDARDATRYAVLLNQGGLSLPDRDYYLKDDDAKLKGFRDALSAAHEKNAGDEWASKCRQDCRRHPGTGNRTAKIQWTKVENRNPVNTYNKTEVAKLPQMLADFDWNGFLSASGVSGTADYVIVRQPGFISGLNKVLKNTPMDVWKAYFKWHVLNTYAPFLSKRFADEDFAFSSVTLRGIPEMQPRWKRGVSRVEESMSQALGQLYVENTSRLKTRPVCSNWSATCWSLTSKA